MQMSCRKVETVDRFCYQQQLIMHGTFRQRLKMRDTLFAVIPLRDDESHPDGIDRKASFSSLAFFFIYPLSIGVLEKWKKSPYSRAFFFAFVAVIGRMNRSNDDAIGASP